MVETASDVSESDVALSETSPLPALPDFAKSAARQQLVEQLVKLGHSPLAAKAIALAVVDPTEVRHHLPYTSTLRVPGGAIHYLTCDVWTPAISTYPGNLREADVRELPIANGGVGYAPLPDIIGRKTGVVNLELAVTAPDHLVHALNESATYLLRTNSLTDEIAQQGILMPAYILPIELIHGDGTEALAMVASLEGSSRVASAHENTAVEPEHPAYLFQRNEGALRQVIGDIRAPLKKVTTELSGEEVAAVRGAIMPANLILSVDTTGDTDVAQAALALVGQLHIRAVKRWSPGAELDAQGDAMLRELAAAGSISEAQHHYYAGHMTKAQATKVGLPAEFDQRAVSIYRATLDSPGIAGRGIRRIIPGMSVPNDLRADVAAELSIRSYRANLNVGEMRTARVALQRIFRRGEFRKVPWKASGRAVEKILDEALGEIAEGEPGPGAYELGLAAAYFLTQHRSLKRPGHGNPLEAEVVLLNMMRMPKGLRQLAQAINDGRSGRPPQVVDDDGRPVTDTTNEAVLVTDQGLREDYAESSGPAPEPEDSDATKLTKAQARFAARRLALETAMEAVNAVEGESKPLVEEIGWPDAQAGEHSKSLEAMSKRLYHLAEVFIQNQKPAVATDSGGEEVDG